jgi:hypothetical protein
MQQREISATGCINRVEKLFAYLRSDYGSVFVPPSSALPTDCTDVDMTKYYRTGDVVHFTAVPQTGKNNCSLLAVKVFIFVCFVQYIVILDQSIEKKLYISGN